MVVNLLIGIPGDRPGGLVLSIIYFVFAGGAALAVGYLYGAVAVALPRASLILQGITAVLRGIPLLLLAFLLAHVSHMSLGFVGFLALLVYSFAHVGEVLRSFLVAYPASVADQGRLMGLTLIQDWLGLRLPWTFWRAFPALLTHWVSLLKDTGALVILGIGELTTVAKILGEVAPSLEAWATVLVTASALYLAATMALIKGVPLLAGMAMGLLRRDNGNEAREARAWA
jgi:ABC-type amino acid transport system permease subunit